MNPYRILEVNKQSDDKTIRAAYLALVSRYTPDSAPKQFQLVNEAYEKIQNEFLRLSYELFNLTSEFESPMGVLEAETAFSHKRKPLPFRTMKELMRECTKI